MAAITPVERAHHIKDSIVELRLGLAHHTLESLRARPLEFAGFKYLLMIISEAAGNIPGSWQEEFGAEVDWINAKNMRNILSHAYHDINAGTLWATYEHDLDPLEAAIDRMIAAHGPTSSRSPSS